MSHSVRNKGPGEKIIYWPCKIYIGSIQNCHTKKPFDTHVINIVRFELKKVQAMLGDSK